MALDVLGGARQCSGGDDGGTMQDRGCALICVVGCAHRRLNLGGDFGLQRCDGSQDTERMNKEKIEKKDMSAKEKKI